VKRNAFIVLIVVAVCARVAAQGAETISTSNLGDLGGGLSHATAINGRAQVVGYSSTPAFETHAFVWTAGEGMRDLGTLGGSYSVATDINDRGQVVGYSTAALDSEEYHAFLWTPGHGMIDLGFGQAFHINNRGEATGVETRAQRALLWTSGGERIVLAPPFSFAAAANDFGVVVGTFMGQAYSWTPAAGGYSAATLPVNWQFAPLAMNNRGVVAGFLYNSYAAIWSQAVGVQTLAALARVEGQAASINDLGQSVGLSDRVEPGPRAVVWRGTAAPVDLGALGITQPWFQSWATDINNFGQIVGGSQTDSGGWRATLWQIALTPREWIEAVGAEVRTMYAIGALNRSEYRLLRARLAMADRRLASGDLRAAQRDLRQFARRIDHLTRKGTVSPDGSALVRAALERAAAALALP